MRTSLCERDRRIVLRVIDRTAKVVRFFKRVCNWAIAEPDGPGQYLLDVDPFQRIRTKEMPRERVDRSYLPVHWPDVVVVLESERRLAL